MTDFSPINAQALKSTVDKIIFPREVPHHSGKVRESFSLGNGERLILVTDRISAFDFILGKVPFKGQVLNQVAAHWFRLLDEINIPHHLIDVPDPNISRVKEGKVIPLEMVVRGYLTGSTTTSSWYAYQHLDRKICGIEMSEGMKKNEAFKTPLITPTTKPDHGHDEPISAEEILKRNIVSPALWEEMSALALKLFAFGQKKSLEQGLILVDTKYEMALDHNGKLMLIDEVHTPDSSRYWIADTYQERMSQGKEPEMLDKEFVRRAVVTQGYDPASPADPRAFFTDTIALEASRKYIELFEKITGKPFVFPKDLEVSERIEQYLRNDFSIQRPL